MRGIILEAMLLHVSGSLVCCLVMWVTNLHTWMGRVLLSWTFLKRNMGEYVTVVQETPF